MINREMITASLLTYTDALDEYGQTRQTTPVTTSIQITKPKLYQHSQVEDIRFQEVTDTCLTLNKSVSDANELRIDGQDYLIKFVNNDGRMAQIFMVAK